MYISLVSSFWLNVEFIFLFLGFALSLVGNTSRRSNSVNNFHIKWTLKLCHEVCWISRCFVILHFSS